VLAFLIQYLEQQLIILVVAVAGHFQLTQELAV
jgi:hypothetical protein